MSDERDPLEAIRELRPDRRPHEPSDPWALRDEKERLMSTIQGTEPTEREWTDMPAIYPRLGYLDEVAALEFLTRAFGFVERREARMGTGVGDDHMLAWLEHGDGIVMIGRAEHEVHRIWSPAETEHVTCMLQVRVRDIDAHYERAMSKGASITMEINDAFYGYRRYEARDLEGNKWHFAEPLADVRRRRGEIDGDGDE